MGEPIAEVGYLAGLCGHTGTDWQKNPLVWGFSEIWDENLGGTADGTSYTKATSTVPSDELWILGAISIRNNTRAGGHTDISIVRASGATMFINYAASVGQYEPLLTTGMFVLGEGDYASVYMAGIQANDVIKAGLTGYKMKLNL